MGAAFPKTDPFEEPPRAEKGDDDAAKPEREEFAKVSDDLEGGAASDLSSPSDVACEGPGMGALPVSLGGYGIY